MNRNKKQLLVIWITGILFFYLCGYTYLNMVMHGLSNPGKIHYNAWQTFLAVTLPILVILIPPSLLIYTLRWRRKIINGDITPKRKISLQQIITVLGIIVAGIIIILLPSEITNKPPWSLPSSLIMYIFSLTIISYPIYLIITFVTWIINKKKDNEGSKAEKKI